MRTVFFALAGAAALAASPAAAQYYHQPYGNGGFGYNGGYADPSGLEQRIYNVLRSLDGVRPDQREQLRYEALSLDRQLRFAARNGLTEYEGHAFDQRIYQLERHQGWAAMNRGHQSYGTYGYQGNNGYYQPRNHGRWQRDDDGDDRDGD